MPQPRAKAPGLDVLRNTGWIDPTLLGDYDKYGTDYDAQLAILGGQDRTALESAGLQQGPGGALSMDPTNFYGTFQNSLRGLADQLHASRSANIGKGLGKRGLAAARERLLRTMAKGDQLGILSGVQHGLDANDTARGNALTARNAGQHTAGERIVNYWAQNAPDDPTADVGIGDAASGASTPVTYSPFQTPTYTAPNTPHEELPDFVNPAQLPDYGLAEQPTNPYAVQAPPYGPNGRVKRKGAVL